MPAEPIQRVARMPMPEIGEVEDLDFPDVERARLSNGIEVVYAQVDTVPVTRVSVSFDAGFAADRADRLGAHSLMLSLLEEGTRTRDANALAEAQERLGANINIGASMDRSSATLSTPSANLAPSLTLLADVIRNPAMGETEFERVRAQRLTGIAGERTQPAAIAARALPPRPPRPDPALLRPLTVAADVAGVCDESGRVFGLMPHPERFIDATQHPAWHGRLDGASSGAGLALFTSAVKAVS